MAPRAQSGASLLLAVATPVEAGAVLQALNAKDSPPPPWTPARLSDRLELLVTGIGKANAAGAVARALDVSRHCAAISVGVAGSLPDSGLGLGDAVAASACIFADEGIRTSERFLDCAAMGFPFADFPGAAVPVDPVLLDRFVAIGAIAAPIATVSTCSGTDGAATDIARRTGARAEAMEGAAVALAARRLGVPAGELRVISNSTGERARQSWDLPAALTRLSSLIGLLAEA